MQNDIETLFNNKPNELTTRERILDVAIDLMSTKGFDAVSIREIARTVGIRESSIYNHFKSKDEILDTMIDYFILELTRGSSPAMDVDEQLETLGAQKFMEAGAKAYLQYISTPRISKIWRILSIELYHSQKIRDFFNNTMIKVPFQAWEGLFGKMIEKKLIKPHDPKLLAREFFSFCIYFYFVQFFLRYDGSTYSFDKELMKEMDDHIRFFIEAIKA